MALEFMIFLSHRPASVGESRDPTWLTWVTHRDSSSLLASDAAENQVSVGVDQECLKCSTEMTFGR